MSNQRSRTRFQARALDRVKQTVLDELSDLPVTVYLFGSWARGEERQSSDVDIAIESSEPIPHQRLVRVRARLEESTIPYVVDVVDLSTAGDTIRRAVKEEGVRWTS